MAKVSNATKWKEVFEQIRQQYEDKLKTSMYYLSVIKVTKGSPLDGLHPRHEKFFGPKICAIAIIGYPYGETGTGSSKSIDWPPTGYEEQKAKIKAGFEQWTKYEVNFWGDKLIIEKVKSVDAEAGAKFEELMNEVFDRIEEDCDGEMREFGWKWKGTIDNPTPEEFYPTLDKFFKVAPAS